MPYTALSAISAGARVYLRPNCFIDTPSTLDGRVARMGNSLIWYHGYEFIVMQDGQRVFHDLVTLDWIEDALFALPDRQQAETRALIDRIALARAPLRLGERSEEHTSELQSLMRISYAVFCLKKKTQM